MKSLIHAHLDATARARTTFRALPTYTLQQLSHRVWQVAKDGQPILMNNEADCRAYLNKWARNEFKTLPRKAV